MMRLACLICIAITFVVRGSRFRVAWTLVHAISSWQTYKTLTHLGDKAHVVPNRVD
jgi:hypothetical protein